MKNVIYKIRNVTNGKFYVGSTVDTRVRFQTHKRRLKKGTHQSPHLQAAWNKYGEECFKFEVVEHVDDPAKLLAAEQRWLDEHAGKAHCYNWATDASAPMRGKKHTEEAKAKMTGVQLKGEQHYRYGKTVSEETRKKIGDTQRGKPKAPGRTISEEGMAKIRAAAEAGHYSHWKGKQHTEESKLKMSKAIVVVYPDGASMLYNSITELRNATGLKPTTINRALKAKWPISKGKFEGWEFFYADDFFDLDTPS